MTECTSHSWDDEQSSGELLHRYLEKLLALTNITWSFLLKKQINLCFYFLGPKQIPSGDH